MRITLTAPVRHDGKALPAGTVMDIDDPGGARLVRLGVAVAAAEHAIEAEGSPVAGKTETAPLAAASSGTKAPEDEHGLDLPAAKAPQDMTVNELKAELEVLELTWPAKANKAELLQLYLQAMAKLDEGDGNLVEGGK